MADQDPTPKDPIQLPSARRRPAHPEVTGFFDDATFTVSYVLRDPDSDACALIDPVLDYDPKSGRTATRSADRLASHVREHGLRVHWILETHVHADHLTGAPYLRERLGGKVAIGARVTTVQETFGTLFNAEASFRRDGGQFDRLLEDGDGLEVGGLRIEVMATPGHTPACVTYVAGDAAFVGDTLFMPDFGSARCDFPGGDARRLYRSVRRILDLPPETRLFMCHDYAPGGRDYAWETTVAEQRRSNIHLRDGIDEEAFVAMRTERDKGLAMPVLLLPSVQINMRAGAFPPPEDNGVSYLKLPLNAL